MDKNSEWALLIGRFILGAVVTAHGLAKLFSFTRVLDTFEQLGIPPVFTAGMIFIEVFGGVALLLGVGVRVAAFFISTIMIGATLFDLSLGLIAGFEFPLTVLGLSVLYIFIPCHLGIYHIRLFSNFQLLIMKRTTKLLNQFNKYRMRRRAA